MYFIFEGSECELYYAINNRYFILINILLPPTVSPDTIRIYYICLKMIVCDTFYLSMLIWREFSACTHSITPLSPRKS